MLIAAIAICCNIWFRHLNPEAIAAMKTMHFLLPQYSGQAYSRQVCLPGNGKLSRKQESYPSMALAMAGWLACWHDACIFTTHPFAATTSPLTVATTAAYMLTVSKVTDLEYLRQLGLRGLGQEPEAHVHHLKVCSTRVRHASRGTSKLQPLRQGRALLTLGTRH